MDIVRLTAIRCYVLSPSYPFVLFAQLLGNGNEVQDIDRPIIVDIRCFVDLTKVLSHQS